MSCEYVFVLIPGVGGKRGCFTAGDYDWLCAKAWLFQLQIGSAGV
jgi:predicted patatin/cPLA2 family phospholipase